MNVTVEEKGLERILTIEDQGEKVRKITDALYKELANQVSVPGFRKGKIPKSVIRARYKDYFAEEVAKRYVNQYLPEILKEKELNPVSPQIAFGDVELEGDDKIKFKVMFEVSPEFELKDYEGLEIEMVKTEVSDEDVQKAIDSLVQQNVKLETADRPVEEGDVVKINYHIKAETGEEEESEFEAEIGANQLRKEIEEELIGKKAGDEVEIKGISLLDEQGNETGKADIKIKILEVKKKIVPEFNDEFVKEVGLGENVEEAKKKIREDLEKQLEEIRKRELEQKIVDKLAEMYDFPVPQSLVEAETEFLLQEYAKQLEQYGIKPNQDMLMTAKEGLRQTAEKNVRVMFVISRIAEKEGIEVTDEELNKEIEKLAEAYQTTPETIKKYLEEQGALDNIRFNILREKVLEKLIEKANIKEISKEEYEKRLEEEKKKQEAELAAQSNEENKEEQTEEKAEETVENKEA